MAYTPIDKPSDYFNTVLYTGNGSTNAITGVGFQPDWLWLKKRNSSVNHFLFDAVRGASKELNCNNTEAEASPANYLSSFDSDGFTIGSDSDINGNSDTLVSWNWLGANGTASNSDGSITTTVSANTTSGFSVMSYTGTGSNATLGHGLGVAPKMVIIKQRNGGDQSWCTFHIDIGAGKFIDFNRTDATNTNGSSRYTSIPSSTVINIGNSDAVNSSNNTFICYAFAEKQGYSKFGSYTGNGSDNGAFIYTGFKPAFVIIKRTDSGENWMQLDNKRNPFNDADSFLFPNNTSAESDANVVLGVDLVSNGFKCRDSDAAINNGEYIYMAFAENPFVTSSGVPATAK